MRMTCLKKVLDWYDWLDEDSKWDGWICYKGHWSHVSRLHAIWLCLALADTPEPFKAWEGVKHDCMSSGTLIKLADDGEEYQIGWYISLFNTGDE